MTTKWLVLLILAIAAATAGCSPSTSTTAVAASTKPVTATIPTTPGSLSPLENLPAEPAPPGHSSASGPGALPTSGAFPAPSLPDMGDLFAPPKLVVPVVSREPEPEPDPQPQSDSNPIQPKKEKKLPQLRLMGFVEVEGLQALLAVEGKLKVVTIGDSADGLQIIAIEPPAITLKHSEDGEEFQMNLFEQPWFHQPGAISGEHRTIGGRPVIQKGPAAPVAPHFGAPPQAPGASPMPLPGAPGEGTPGLPPRAPVPGAPGIYGPPEVPGHRRPAAAGFEVAPNSDSKRARK